MKRKRVLGAVVACLLLLTCFGGMTVAAEGASFDRGFHYKSEEALSQLPATVEATVRFPSDMKTRGGVVIGNYTSSGNVCMNFEIYSDGIPRLYLTNEYGTVYDVQFEKVSVYTGEWVHVALVKDSAAGTVSCYIDGELKQTVTAKTPETIAFDNEMVLGSDLRSGNGQYFKGELRDVALYADMRTAAEIAADCAAETPDTNELLGYYKLDGTQDTLTDPTGKGPAFKKTEFFIKDHESVTEYDYSIAVVGDIQSLTCYYPDKVHHLYDWIVDNVDDKKIAFVAGLGDITDKDTDVEWELAKSEMAKMNGVVPYSVVRGNHDSTGQYNNYFSYEEYKDTVDGAFKETMMNTYHKVKVGGVKYLFLNLDLLATDNMLNWANEVIEKHKDYNVIITTHIYLSAKGETFDDASSSSLTRYGMENFPDVIWDKVVSRHENISMVLCGHAPTDTITVQQRQGVHGNTVTEILVDPQTTDKTYEGTGLVAMLYFSDGGKKVDVEYYATVQEGHFLRENQFSLDVDVIESTNTWLLPVIIAAVVVIAAAVVILLVFKSKKKAQ